MNYERYGMTTEQKLAFYQAELGWLARTLDDAIRFRFGLGMALFSLNILLTVAGFYLRSSAVLFLASGFLVMLLCVDFVLIRSIFGYYYRANRILVQELDITDDNVFDMAMIFLTFRKMKEIHLLMNIENEAERYRALRRLPFKIPTFLGFFAPLIVFVAELGIAFLSLGWAGWRF